MQPFLITALALAAAATLYVLIKGLIGMASGSGQLHAVRSQNLMQKRVLYQAVAIVVAVLLILVGRG
ncbi:MAG TPA: HIG1 domain-containing protein [Allosphingosinicella sp.]|nr:HIG1 domain-containing protein [Allosphingosinicella sp.]